jgi:hypothetical protein
MNKQELIEKIKHYTKSLHLRPDQVVVGFDSAMVLLGLREEVMGLYLEIPYPQWYDFLSMGGKKQATPFGYVFEWDENVIVQGGFLDISAVTWIDGIQCQREDLLLWSYQRLLPGGLSLVDLEIRKLWYDAISVLRDHQPSNPNRYPRQD